MTTMMTKIVRMQINQHHQPRAVVIKVVVVKVVVAAREKMRNKKQRE